MSEELTKQLQRLARSLDQRHASGLSLPRVLLVDVARQLRAAADLIESQQARIDELRYALTDVMAHLDAHPPLGQSEHEHDCYELWCIERDHARIVLAASPDTPETRP